jgi:hypothetical protein
VISNGLENLSISMGFPFVNYHFPGDGKIFQVPWFVSLGYLATGYLAWIVATFIAILALFRVAQRRATIALSDPHMHRQNNSQFDTKC